MFYQSFSVVLNLSKQTCIYADTWRYS